MRINKILTILLLFSICLSILSFIPTSIAADKRISTGGITVAPTSDFDKIGSVILGAIQGIGIGFSVIALVIIGIKFMLGSAEEKAEYKSHLVPYIIGVVFLAAATTLPNAIYNMVN